MEGIEAKKPFQNSLSVAVVNRGLEKHFSISPVFYSVPIQKDRIIILELKPQCR
jgi:hypothetical protein